MADPITLAIIAGAAAVGGKIMDMNNQVGQYQSQSAIETENARRLRLQAGQAGAEGAQAEGAVRRDYRAVAGVQGASFAESGLGNTGSAYDVIRSSETRANLDALNARYKGTNEAASLNNEAANAESRAGLAKQMAKRAKLAGYIGIVGAAAGAAGNVAGAAGGANPGAGASSGGGGSRFGRLT